MKRYFFNGDDYEEDPEGDLLFIEEVFVEELSALCERFEATFFYTTDDDGIHIEIFGREIFTGHIHNGAAAELRNEKNHIKP